MANWMSLPPGKYAIEIGGKKQSSPPHTWPSAPFGFIGEIPCRVQPRACFSPFFCSSGQRRTSRLRCLSRRAHRRTSRSSRGTTNIATALTLFMVASGERLVAIIGEAKYALRAAGTDTFTNPSGDPIPFLRDATGRIVAFKESGDTFARLSSNVPAATRRLLEPRPRGPNGLPVVYRYEPPARLPDGIRIGEAGPDTLPPEVAEQLVNGVIDGTYPDVRSILVYRKGALLLEEYFYGYDRDRPHQMRSLTKSVISLLAGAAVDRGLLRADEPVLARLGYSAYENPDPRKAKVTLTDLLSNQSGFACNDHDRDSPGNEVKLYETPDWAKAFVDLPMAADPGTVGRYCSGGIFHAGPNRRTRGRQAVARVRAGGTVRAPRHPTQPIGSGTSRSIAASVTSSGRSISGRATC